MTATVILLFVALGAAFTTVLLRRQGVRRQRAVRELLDSADSLEARLRTARSEIEAIAGPGEDPVREAMQEMLRQRLWLKQHGASASLEDLRRVRSSFDAARARLDQQLDRLERARASSA